MQIRSVCDELQEEANKLLNEDSTRIQNDVDYIKDWIFQQPHLIARTDDQWLISFLRTCKFRYETTKHKLDTYYTAKSAVQEFFLNRDPLQKNIQDVLNLGVFLPLPEVKHPAAPRVILIRPGIQDPKKISFTDIFKVIFMILDILIVEDDNFIIAGQQLVFDFKAVDVGDIAYLTPSIMKKIVVTYQQAYPSRPQVIYCINVNPFFKAIYNLILPFLSDKIKKRINIVDTTELNDFYKDIPESILPTEYGGQSGSIEEITAKWTKKVESYRDWYIEDTKYGSVESKRQGELNYSSTLFGIEGSFKKLSVD